MAKRKKQNKQSINIFALAYLHALVLGFVGLILGIVYSFGGAIYDFTTTGSMNAGTALAFLALIGMPLIGITLGLIAGLVEGLLFNLAAKIAKGIDIGDVFSS